MSSFVTSSRAKAMPKLAGPFAVVNVVVDDNSQAFDANSEIALRIRRAIVREKKWPRQLGFQIDPRRSIRGGDAI